MEGRERKKKQVARELDGKLAAIKIFSWRQHRVPLTLIGGNPFAAKFFKYVWWLFLATIVRWAHHGPAQFSRQTWPSHKLQGPESGPCIRVPAGPKSCLRVPHSLFGQRPFLPSKVCSACAENLFGTDNTSLHQTSGSKPCLRAPGAEQRARLPSSRSGSSSRLPARYLLPRRIQAALHPLTAFVCYRHPSSLLPSVVPLGSGPSRKSPPQYVMATHGRHGAQARDDEQRSEDRGEQQAPALQGPTVLPPPPPMDYGIFMQGLTQAHTQAALQAQLQAQAQAPAPIPQEQGHGGPSIMERFKTMAPPSFKRDSQPLLAES
ncbi:hypothetical protein Taro_026263 [Colocasia esculenta]|uniref:Uncharacterized protein n=1 Tax=Colocasia esculenta TaxID=4460 RepID=A0A843VQU2_COLES|nr:hypothetical protein [Colocasia esculenta]